MRRRGRLRNFSSCRVVMSSADRSESSAARSMALMCPSATVISKAARSVPPGDALRAAAAPVATRKLAAHRVHFGRLGAREPLAVEKKSAEKKSAAQGAPSALTSKRPIRRATSTRQPPGRTTFIESRSPNQCPRTSLPGDPARRPSRFKGQHKRDECCEP